LINLEVLLIKKVYNETGRSQYSYPAFMLIDLVAVGSACFPGLASIPNSEKIHSSTIFGNLSKGI